MTGIGRVALLTACVVIAGSLLSACTTNGIDVAGTPVATSSAVANPTPTARQSATANAGLPSCPALRPAAPVSNGLPVTAFQCLGPGPALNLASLRGIPSVVNVWASWCLPCRDETTALVDAHNKLGAKVRFVGVDIQDEATAAQRFMTDFNVTYPSGFDQAATVRAPLRVIGPPVTFLVDAHGVIVDRIDGGVGSTAAVLAAVRKAFGIAP